MIKHTNEDGTEIEVYTADEVQQQIAAKVTEKESEFGNTRAQIEAERDEARKALGERADEFKNFRKLNDETVAKLSVAERTIYENGLRLKEAEDKRAEAEKASHEKAVDASIRSKVGTDEKLFTKMKEMYSVIGIDATTPEEIEKKTGMVLGALRVSEPDLVASLNGQGGGGNFIPPQKPGEQNKGFGDTEQGKAFAAELGLTIEAPKK